MKDYYKYLDMYFEKCKPKPILKSKKPDKPKKPSLKPKKVNNLIKNLDKKFR